MVNFFYRILLTLYLNAFLIIAEHRHRHNYTAPRPFCWTVLIFLHNLIHECIIFGLLNKILPLSVGVWEGGCYKVRSARMSRPPL